MADTYRVALDLDRIKQNLFVSEGQYLNDDQIRAFLVGCGFQQDGDKWIAEEISLAALSADEIIDKRLPI